MKQKRDFKNEYIYANGQEAEMKKEKTIRHH